MTLADRTLVRFAELVGAAPDFAVRAPGRVNLIGEHTDYNDGFVLPAAIGLQSIVAVRRRPDSIVRMIAADFGDAVSAFDLAQPMARDPNQPWSDYIRGVATILQAEGVDLGGLEELGGVDFRLESGEGFASAQAGKAILAAHRSFFLFITQHRTKLVAKRVGSVRFGVLIGSAIRTRRCLLGRHVESGGHFDQALTHEAGLTDFAGRHDDGVRSELGFDVRKHSGHVRAAVRLQVHAWRLHHART